MTALKIATMMSKTDIILGREGREGWRRREEEEGGMRREEEGGGRRAREGRRIREKEQQGMKEIGDRLLKYEPLIDITGTQTFDGIAIDKYLTILHCIDCLRVVYNSRLIPL